MDIDKMTSLANRFFFAIALLMLLAGGLEKVVNLMGYTILKNHTPERLLDISVAFAVFILVFLVRQIRQEVRALNSKK